MFQSERKLSKFLCFLIVMAKSVKLVLTKDEEYMIYMTRTSIMKILQLNTNYSSIEISLELKQSQFFEVSSMKNEKTKRKINFIYEEVISYHDYKSLQIFCHTVAKARDIEPTRSIHHIEGHWRIQRYRTNIDVQDKAESRGNWSENGCTRPAKIKKGKLRNRKEISSRELVSKVDLHKYYNVNRSFKSM